MSVTPATGVQPEHSTTIGISTSGVPQTLSSGSYTDIPELEGCNLTIDGVTQEWTPMNMQGWNRAMVTGKKVTMSLTCNRVYGDTVHDYIAGKMMATGTACETAIKITFPDLDTLIIPCIINVKSVGGNTTDVDKLTFDLISNGLPEYTAYSA